MYENVTNTGLFCIENSMILQKKEGNLLVSG